MKAVICSGVASDMGKDGSTLADFHHAAESVD
jgi:hypothetical protein